MERILHCPQRFPTKSAAQKVLGVEIRKAKETGHSRGWNLLKLYFCRECGSYHIWPRRPARNRNGKGHPGRSMSVNRLISTTIGRHPAQTWAAFARFNF